MFFWRITVDESRQCGCWQAKCQRTAETFSRTYTSSAAVSSPTGLWSGGVLSKSTRTPALPAWVRDARTNCTFAARSPNGFIFQSVSRINDSPVGPKSRIQYNHFGHKAPEGSLRLLQDYRCLRTRGLRRAGLALRYGFDLLAVVARRHFTCDIAEGRSA